MLKKGFLVKRTLKLRNTEWADMNLGGLFNDLFFLGFLSLLDLFNFLSFLDLGGLFCGLFDHLGLNTNLTPGCVLHEHLAKLIT